MQPRMCGWYKRGNVAHSPRRSRRAACLDGLPKPVKVGAGRAARTAIRVQRQEAVAELWCEPLEPSLPNILLQNMWTRFDGRNLEKLKGSGTAV